MEIMKKYSMSDGKFCKILDEQYAAWHPGQKVLFLECMSHSLTRTVRNLCGKPEAESAESIKTVGLLNEIQHRIPQAARDILVSVGTINGDWFCPGEALLGHAKAMPLRKGAIQEFTERVICDTNFRIAAVADEEKDASRVAPKAEPVFRGLTQIDTSALKIRQNLWS